MSSSPVVPERNGDAASWRTLKTISAATVMAAGVFGAGMAWGARLDDKLSAQQKHIDETFIRKDGKELEGINGELRQLNKQVSDLMEELRSQRRGAR